MKTAEKRQFDMLGFGISRYRVGEGGGVSGEERPRMRVSFVVRMAEGMAKDRREWRGVVENVALSEQVVFSGVDQLLKAMEELERERPH